MRVSNPRSGVEQMHQVNLRGLVESIIVALL